MIAAVLHFFKRVFKISKAYFSLFNRSKCKGKYAVCVIPTSVGLIHISFTVDSVYSELPRDRQNWLTRG